LQAVRVPSLDASLDPRPRDMPEPVHERPNYMKRRARRLVHEAARLAEKLQAEASTLGVKTIQVENM